MHSHHDEPDTPATWHRVLVSNADDATEVLEALTRYGLASLEQHTALLECPGLVQAVVCTITSPCCQCQQPRDDQPADAPPRDVTTASLHCECTDAALTAANSLAISTRGVEALLAAGALNAASTVLQACACACVSSTRPCKKQRTDTGPPPDSDSDDGTSATDVLVLTVQLLATLLLQPSGARPAVGSVLPPGLAADTACALLQVLSERHWQQQQQQLSAKQRLDAVAVLMRLGMEPVVAEMLCQRVEASALASNAQCETTVSLASLLGAQCTEQQFLSSHWEAEPLLCRVAASHSTQSNSKTPQPRAANARDNTTSITACYGADSSGRRVRQALLQFTPSGVVEQLLPGTTHCPLLAAGLLDPVQVLHELRVQGVLLQPLQLNQDIRIVKTEQQQAQAHTASDTGTGTSTAAAAAGPSSASASGGHIAREVLYSSSTATGAVSGQDCLAALQSGFTVVLRDMPKRCMATALLAEGLEAQLGLAAGANLYLTPPGSQGLQPHYDDRCIWVLQLSGSKRWLVGPPQHAQLPLTRQERLPVVTPPLSSFDSPTARAGGQSATQQQLQYSNDSNAAAIWPQELVLHAGDCLYIPRGWVHSAAAATTAGSSAGDVLAGSSVHLSVGVEVTAQASVQGLLHHLIEVCAGRVVAGTSCCGHSGLAGSANTNHPQLQPLAVTAAALLLHVHLWLQAQAHPVYRSACPALAAGDTAQLLAAGVLRRLQQGHSSRSTKPPAHPQPAAQAAQAGLGQQPLADSAAVRATDAPSGGKQQQQQQQQQREAVPTEVPEVLQPHGQWVAFTVQQLLCEAFNVEGPAIQQQAAPCSTGNGGSSSSSSGAQQQQQQHVSGEGSAQCGVHSSNRHAELLLELVKQLLCASTDNSSTLRSRPDGLLGLPYWLEACSASASHCSTCSSSCCHSELVCAAAAAACAAGGGGGAELQAASVHHIVSCACCQRVVSAQGTATSPPLELPDSVAMEGLLHAAALRVPEAAAALAGALSCAACQAAALCEYKQTARAQLQSYQAVRRGFVAAAAAAAQAAAHMLG